VTAQLQLIADFGRGEIRAREAEKYVRVILDRTIEGDGPYNQRAYPEASRYVTNNVAQDRNQEVRQVIQIETLRCLRLSQN
jgi:hypothetical protein